MHSMTRRSIVKSALMAGALIPAYNLLGRRADAAALPALDPSDPTAKSLGFVTDATKVSAAANPTYKPGQKCSSCAQFQGKAADASAPCTIFTGHSVPAGGWCKVYAPKPA
jgi:hypothetical protein